MNVTPGCKHHGVPLPVPPAAASPGHAAVVTHPAVLLLVVAAAGLAGVHVTVQTLTLAVDQELKGLQATDAEGVRQLALRAQQLALRVLLLNFSLQLSGKQEDRQEAVRQDFLRILRIPK